MDLIKTIAELRAERDHLDQAIVALEQYARTRKKRSKSQIWIAAAIPGEPPGNSRKSGSVPRHGPQRMDDRPGSGSRSDQIRWPG